MKPSQTLEILREICNEYIQANTFDGRYYGDVFYIDMALRLDKAREEESSALERFANEHLFGPALDAWNQKKMQKDTTKILGKKDYGVGGCQEKRE